MPVTDDADDYNARLRRRMLMARIEAGYGDNIEDLRERLVELGYDDGWSAATLGAMERGRDSRKKPRAIRPEEVPVLAEACGVAPAFFHIDFSQLDKPDLRQAIKDLRTDLADLALTVAQQGAELQAFRDQRPPEEPPGDDPR